MKRIAFLLVCGALVGSAQEFRLNRAVLLKSERSIVSLRAGTIVDVLSWDEQTLTVRFNNHTGVIPAGSTAEQAKSSFGSSAKKSGSQNVNAVNKTKEDAASHGEDNVKHVDIILAAN